MTTTNTNSTAYVDAAKLAVLISDTCYAAGVDLDGCVTAADVLAAVEAQCPASLDEVLTGHGSHDPTLRRWLDERGADLHL